MAIKGYKKLPGRKTNMLGYDLLYEGPDHLLLVQTQGAAEKYRRFHYADIQALVVRKTVSGMIQSIVCLVFTLLFSWGVYGAGADYTMVFVFLGAPFLIYLLVNLVRGPTCQTRIMTAVQTETLKSLDRLWRTKKVITRLVPKIQSAQGPLASEILAGPEVIRVAKVEEPAPPPKPAAAPGKSR
jgi:hypothetical protein